MKKILLALLCTLVLTSCTTPTPPVSNTASGSVAAKVMIPSPTYGSGSTTVTPYADLQCPACIAFSHSIGPIFEEYAKSGKLTITYKQYPLTSIHKNALRDSIAGLCAAEQGHYMEYKKNLYALEEAKAWATVSDADRINAAVGTPLDASKLTECLTADKYLPQVRAEMAEGDAAGVNATPTVLLDDRKLDMTLFKDVATLKNFMDKYLGVTPLSTEEVK